MSIDIWLVYVVAAIGLSLTPGPNGLLCLTHGIQHGVRRTFFTALGGVFGFLLLIAVSMVGLGVLLAASEQAFTAAKWIGAGYLVYLGIKTWRAPPPGVTVDATGGKTRAARPARLFTQGFLVAASNPKALIFFAAFLPQFIDPAATQLMQFIILGGTFAVIEFVYEMILAGAAQRIAPWLAQEHVGRWFNRTAGATFVGIGGVLASVNR